MNKLIVIAGTIVLVTVIGTVLCYFYVRLRTSNRIFDTTDEIPYNRVGLLLGTNPVTTKGTPNFYFIYRIRACTELYRAGKISIILISGDNHIQTYNEPQYMKEALMAQGIPESAIVLDYAGFRTLDSIVRAKKVFGQDCLTIITQPYHNERAVFLARHYGIDAIGYNAREIRNSKTYLKYGFVREALARVKMFMDIICNKHPKFLGEKIHI